MAVKAKGTLRIDVTLRGEMRDDYATIRRYLQGFYRIPAARISHAEIIKLALSRAAKAIIQDGSGRREGSGVSRAPVRYRAIHPVRPST